MCNDNILSLAYCLISCGKTREVYVRVVYPYKYLCKSSIRAYVPSPGIKMISSRWQKYRFFHLFTALFQPFKMVAFSSSQAFFILSLSLSQALRRESFRFYHSSTISRFLFFQSLRIRSLSNSHFWLRISFFFCHSSITCSCISSFN